jgi:hypothetical protein
MARSFAVRVASDRSGNAIVTWVDAVPPSGPFWIKVVRYTPGAGWSGVETLAAAVPGYFGITAAYPAIDASGNAVVMWRQPNAALTSNHLVASTFSGGSWSGPVTLDTADTSGGRIGIRFTPDLATDTNGGFMAVWTQEDAPGNQVYASRRTIGAPWSAPVLLNAPETAAPDGGRSKTEQTLARVAMSPNGDALVSMRPADTTTTIYSTDAVTFTVASGFSAPVHLGDDNNDIAPPLMDGCGNGTLVWIRRTDGNIWAARHVRGGSWTTATRVDTQMPVTNGLLDAAVGGSGEVVASWSSQNGFGMAAAELR